MCSWPESATRSGIGWSRPYRAPRDNSAEKPGHATRRRSEMPAKTEKQRKFMGAELQRKREGKKTKTDMSEKELEKMASKKKS
jgi:hypothetical protein